MASSESRIAAYYDWLSRYHNLARRVGHTGGFDSLTVHRLLTSDRPGVRPADVVHDRIVSAARGLAAAPHVVDAGCGLGGTIFYLHHRLRGRYEGLTLSAVQQSRATREAERRGIAESCRFHVRSYDEPLNDLVPAGADLIVAIESLAHARDPAIAIARLGGALRPGGLIAIVDDVPGDALADDDADFLSFRAGWSCPAIARRSTLEASLRTAQLTIERDEDLTPLVPRRDSRELERLVRVNRFCQRTFGRLTVTLLGALYGGLMLERLYRRGLMSYRLIVARADGTARRSGYTLAP